MRQVHRTHRLGALSLAVVATLTCSGTPSPDRGDAAPAVDAPAPARDGQDPIRDAASQPERPIDAAEPPDSRPVPTGLPLPSGVAPPRRVLDGDATVTGDGLTSCTHQEPPSGDGDRWCAFARPAATVGSTELWVMNVSAAAREGTPACDGSSRGCVKLTASLWTSTPSIGPSHPYNHAFDGDTLVFYADSTTTSAELHRGPIYAWRPGWSKARQLSSARGMLCTGHRGAAVAYCIDDVTGDPMHPDDFELRAGPIGDEAGDILPSVGRARAFRSDGSIAWQVGFSPKGDVFAISSPDPDPAVETLRAIATADTAQAQPKELIRDLTSWTISNDGQKLYFLREESRTVHGLAVTSFPVPATVTSLASKVEDYVVVGGGAADQGVGFITRLDSGMRAFRLLRDTTLPASARTVFTFEDTIEDAQISPDGRYTAWRDTNLVARIVHNDDLASCVLNSSEQVDATYPVFLAGSGLVFWSENAADDPNRQDGFWGSPDGCKERKPFARGLYIVEEPVGDRGFIFADERDPSDDSVTLKYAAVTRSGDATRLETPVRIHAGVRPAVTLVGTNPLLLLYRKLTGPPTEVGTYLFGPVPF
jgi:hypothetical protein